MTFRIHEVMACTLLILFGTCAWGQEAQDENDVDRLLRAGDFEQARRVLMAELKSDSEDAQRLLDLAEISLLRNHCEEAKAWIDRSIAAGAEGQKVDELRGELHYRELEFQEAAECFERVGLHAKAKKLASFQGVVPYRIESSIAGPVRIEFVRTDPLPVVRIGIDDSDPVFAIIDTGGGELILDPDFAATINARKFGETESTFAGGKKTNVTHARVNQVRLGECTVHDVPVLLLPTRRFAPAAGGLPIDAVIGTTLLRQFLFTIDYRTEQLVLEAYSDSDDSRRPEGIEVPIFLAGDHLILAKGRINDGQQMLFLVDTGLAGQAFTCPKSTLDDNGIKLAGPELTGQGGGGSVKVTMFAIESLSLDQFRKSNLSGLFGAFPEQLQNANRFQIDGIISHAFFRDNPIRFNFANMTLTIED